MITFLPKFNTIYANKPPNENPDYIHTTHSCGVSLVVHSVYRKTLTQGWAQFAGPILDDHTLWHPITQEQFIEILFVDLL